MVNKPAVSRAAMTRAIAALEASGASFGGFRLHPDGTVDVLRAENMGRPVVATAEDELAEWLAAHGDD